MLSCDTTFMYFGSYTEVLAIVMIRIDWLTGLVKLG